MRFLDELEKVLKADERFIGEDNQVIKTKVSDAARGFRVIIMTQANSQVNTKALELLPKFKMKKMKSRCAV